MCRYFNLRRPRIEWFEYIDWGKTAGRTYEDGRIHLVHPGKLEARTHLLSASAMWIQMIYHEMGHFLFWTDPERKADLFSRRMIIGLKVRNRRAASRDAQPRRNFERTSRGKSPAQTACADRERTQNRDDHSRRVPAYHYSEIPARPPDGEQADRRKSVVGRNQLQETQTASSPRPRCRSCRLRWPFTRSRATTIRIAPRKTSPTTTCASRARRILRRAVGLTSR